MRTTLALLLLVACGGGAPAPECEEGFVGCLGPDRPTSCIDGQLVAGAPCECPAVCMPGIGCLPEPADRAYCVDDMTLGHRNTTETEACPYGCHVLSCEASCAECRAGTAECRGDTLVECSSIGVVTRTTECRPGTCDATLTPPACAPATCAEPDGTFLGCEPPGGGPESRALYCGMGVVEEWICECTGCQPGVGCPAYCADTCLDANTLRTCDPVADVPCPCGCDPVGLCGPARCIACAPDAGPP